MLQATKNKYTLETLLPLNASYDQDHYLEESDVDMANAFVELIERTRTHEHPQVGDLMVHVSKHGDYSPRALIEKVHDESLSVCIHPSIPFVYRKDNGIGCDVSGGPFDRVKIPDVKFKGWDTAYFKEWGHCGPRANGSVSFAARVAGKRRTAEINELVPAATQTHRKEIDFERLALGGTHPTFAEVTPGIFPHRGSPAVSHRDGNSFPVLWEDPVSGGHG